MKIRFFNTSLHCWEKVAKFEKIHCMEISLSRFETDLLNKYIHTQTFDELSDLQVTMNESLNAQKERLIGDGETDEVAFNSFASRTIANITDFLVSNQFYHAREGGVYFLTDKGKHLKAQRTLHDYVEWEKIRDKELVDEMHVIQSKGYLDREQPKHADLAPPLIDNEKKSNWIYYLLIILAIVAFYLIGKHRHS